MAQLTVEYDGAHREERQRRQDRLVNLARISIDSLVVGDLKASGKFFNMVIDHFATVRDRRMVFLLGRNTPLERYTQLDSAQVVGESRMMDKLSSLLVQESRPLQDTISAPGSSFSNRLIHPKCVKRRYRRSFLPATVRFYNQHCSQYSVDLILYPALCGMSAQAALKRKSSNEGYLAPPSK
ncbi:uncharacterized protein AB9X84_021674 [Acanthopagrus schlegelii]